MSRAFHTPDTVREKLRQLLEDSKIPQDAFATLVLGCDQAALSSYLRGKAISLSRQKQIRRIVSVRSQNGQVTVVATFQPTKRWKTEVTSRAFTAQQQAQATPTLARPVSPSPTGRTSDSLPVETPDGRPLDRLNHELGQWTRSCRVREYVAAVRKAYKKIDPASDLGKWVLWLERFAANVDPIPTLEDAPGPQVSLPPIAEEGGDDKEDDPTAVDLDELSTFAEFDDMVREELERLP